MADILDELPLILDEVKSRVIGISILGLDISMNIPVMSFSSALQQTQKVRYSKQQNSNLIDVIEYDDSIIVIVMLPGIKKENVKFTVRNGIIDLKICKKSQWIQRIIPCKVQPKDIIVRSLSVKNSVLEIIFQKRS